MLEYLSENFRIKIGSEGEIWDDDRIDQVLAAARWPSWAIVRNGRHDLLTDIDEAVFAWYVLPIILVEEIRVQCPSAWYRMPPEAQILRVAEELDRSAETARELLARACGGPPRSIEDLTFEVSFRGHVVTIPGRDLVETPIDIIGRWTSVYYTGDGVGSLRKPSTEAREVPMLAPMIDRVRAEIDALPPRREEDLASYARHRLLEVIEYRYDIGQRVDDDMWPKK
jgi:hypothetical protein